MKKIVLIVIINLITFSFGFGQGTIRGKITDNTGEALIGAIVRLKANPAVGTMADLDGNYSLKISDSAAQILVVSYVSYTTQEVTVHPIKGEVIVKDFVLESVTSIEEVVITTKATKSNNYYMENVKINSSTTMDYISQETMKKTGDASVVNAVARVSGVSASSSAGFITVRGIGDRYVKTTLNGSRIPTLDPFTNNIRLDLFPASLVDNIILTKTASPDQPGDWAGAYLSIETKDYPEKLEVNVESSIGYNAQTTFKDVVSTPRSKTDWLGYDNGFRDHSHNQNGPAPQVLTSDKITPYLELSALGLGDYYHSIGVTNSTPWNSTYFDLGLVQLGLLDKSQLDDQAAIANATNQYNNGPYFSQAFNALNANAAKFGQSFNDNWNTTTRKAIPNLTQSFSIGNQVKLFGRPLGFLGGFRYGSTTQYDPNSTVNRMNSNGSYDTKINQQASQETNSWSALMNIAYKFSPNHSVSLLFMPNFTGSNSARNSLDISDPNQNVITKSQFYDQRKQIVYQYKSEHYFSKPKLKVELNASYTNGKSSAPDFKDVQYFRDPNSNTYQIGATIGNGLHRYYRYLSDNLFDSRLSAEFPIGKSGSIGPRKMKFGGAYQFNNKKSDQYDYNLNIDKAYPEITNDNINLYLSPSNFTIVNNTVPMYYDEPGYAANHTFGKSNILAGYLMTDYTIIKKLRVSGGVRVEKAHIYTDAFLYDSLHLAANDPRRSYKPGLPILNPGKLDNVSFLPSVNVIYKLRDLDEAPINVRVNFSQTVARPSIRELSDVSTFDYSLRAPVIGNSSLKQVQIKNYDVRFEWYFKNKDNISLSVFYKDFKNHIVLVNYGSLSWQNVDKSYAQGIEIEGKKKISKYFDLIANATLVKSNNTFTRYQQDIMNGIIVYTPRSVVSASMYGQAPYIVNFILAYTAPEKLGLNATLSYNTQGRRLAIISASDEIPNVYEMPRNMFDFKIMKKIGKHFTTSLTVRDILNTAVRRTYIYNNGKQIDYDKFRYGTNYILSVAYKL